MSESQIDNTENQQKIKKILSEEELKIKNEKAAIYREQHKDMLTEYRKIYYQANKARWVSQNVFLICELCNNRYKKCHSKRHASTKKHQRYLLDSENI